MKRDITYCWGIAAIIDKPGLKFLNGQSCIQHLGFRGGSVSGDCCYRTGAGQSAGAQTGVKHIADTIAQYIEADDDEKDHQAGHDGNMGCCEHLSTAFAQHRAEIGLRRLRAKAQKTQTRCFKDHPASSR